MKKILWVSVIIVCLAVVIAISIAGFWLWKENKNQNNNILQKAQKENLILVDEPLLGQEISSPVVIKGKARGYWFFEASFPVFLVNWDGLIIAQGLANAKGDWMTEDFVPFEAKIDFVIDKETYSNRGAIILKKDNPSGLPEHDDALEFPIFFRDVRKK